MFIVWSDADAEWVGEIEIVSSCECENVFNPFQGFATLGKEAFAGEWQRMNVHM